jgi:hypothetical protein
MGTGELLRSRLQTTAHVDHVHAQQIFDFLLNCTDEQYMDEWVGAHRLRMHVRVVQALPGRMIARQLEKWVPLPFWLRLELADDVSGASITHIVEAGSAGPDNVKGTPREE